MANSSRQLSKPAQIRSLVIALVVALFALLIGLGIAPKAIAVGADATAKPTLDLRNGQAITIAWSGFAPNDSVYIRQCVRGAKTAAQCASGSGLVTETSTNEGSGLTYYYVVSTEGTEFTSLPGADGTKCGPSFPCDIVVTSPDDFGNPSAGVVIPISFAAEATSCPTENMNNITGAGTSALSVLMTDWQLGLCNGADRVSLNYISSRGDVGGIYDFNCGLVDMAFTEISASESDEPTKCGTQTREGVYVPIANSALVFAFSLRNRLDYQPFASVKLNADMLAQTMTGQAMSWGSHDDSDSINRAIYALNNDETPKLLNLVGDGKKLTFTALSNFSVGDKVLLDDAKPSMYNGDYIVDSVEWVDNADHSKGQIFTAKGTYNKKPWENGGVINPTNLLPGYVGTYGRADASGLNLLLTKFLLQRAESAFRAGGSQFSSGNFPAPSVFMPMSDRFSAGAFKSNQSALVINMQGSNDQTANTGAVATLDAATANYYGFPAISIGSTDGKKFVAPTLEAMQKGLAAMKVDDKTNVATADLAPTDQEAYPLVFTVYALVPKHPESKDSLDGIKAMLTYIKDHSSQDKLPDGYVALTTSQKQTIDQALSSLTLASPSPSPSVSTSPTPSESPAEITPTLPTDITPISGGFTGGTDVSTTTGGNVASGQTRSLPSIFAFPFSPKTGSAAAIIPAVVLIGAATSVSGLLQRGKKLG